MSWREEIEEFLERMGYHNVEQDVETNQLSMDFWPPPKEYMIWRQRSMEHGWQVPAEEDRLVRYRLSSNGIWQEVWLLANGHYFYGLYMPEGFVPPPGMGE